MTARRDGQAPNVDKVLIISTDDLLVWSLRLAHQAPLCAQVAGVDTSRAREAVEPRTRAPLPTEDINELAVPQNRRRSAGRKARHNEQEPPNMAVDRVISVALGAQPLYETPCLGCRR
jgi:hypothetical protein